MKEYYVTVELFLVEGEDEREVRSRVIQEIERLGLGKEPCEVSVEEAYLT